MLYTKLHYIIYFTVLSYIKVMPNDLSSGNLLSEVIILQVVFVMPYNEDLLFGTLNPSVLKNH